MGRSILASALALFLVVAAIAAAVAALTAAPAHAVNLRWAAQNDILTFGAYRLKVLHTPGHSPGSISLLGDGFVLSGDTLFMEGVGRTDLPGGSRPELVRSIREKLMTLPDETIVLPGHGPHTTIGHERRTNPFVGTGADCP